ncbi:MAG: hypothetical protein RIC38_05885, partial [Chromatocurvus sp.]
MWKTAGFIVSLMAASSVSIADPFIERETDATVRAYAAGYRAGFVCSALFNGGKSLAQIEAQELSGIYPLVADLVPDMPMAIDRELRRVSVSWDDTMPPRMSQWRPHLGCVDLPVGAGAAAADAIPGIEVSGFAVAGDVDDAGPWKTRADV